MKFFEVDGDSVSFQDGSTAVLSDRVYNAKHDEIGELIDIHPSDEKIFVRSQSGKATPFSATSVKSKGLTGMPF